MLNPSPPLNVLLAGRDIPAVRAIEALLTGQPGIAPMVRLLPSTVANPLTGLGTAPDVLVLCCDDAHLQELEALAAIPAVERPPLVLCGALRSADAARLAVRCGAADLLPAEASRAELLDALHRAARIPKSTAAAGREPGTVCTVIGAAGGVGASFIATNLAHLTVQDDRRAAVLVDLDLLYAPLTAYLGVKPELGLAAALDRVETLDPVALNGYIARTRTGLALMSGTGRGLPDASGVSAERFRALLGLLTSGFDRVVVDGSRWLDPLTTVAVLDSKRVVIVLEQSIGNVHNAARLYSTLTRELGLPRERLVVVLNRYSRRVALTPGDVERALGCGEVQLVAGEYELARDSLDAATPVAEKDRRSALTRALGALNQLLNGPSSTSEAGTGFLRRALPLFRKG